MLLGVLLISFQTEGWASGGKSVQSAEIVISALENNQYGPAVVYNWKHREYLVVWENVWPGGSHDIYAQRVSETGELLSWFFIPDGTVSTADRIHPDVAYDPVLDRYLVVWVADVGGDLDVIGRFIPWEGPDPALHEFWISNSINDEWKPKVAFARGEEPMQYLVVWMNSAGGGDTWIGFSRVMADGSGTLPDVHTLSQGTGDRDFPEIDYTRSNNTFLVVWDYEDSGDLDIYGKRLHGDGTAIGSEFAISSYPGREEHPVVAACPEVNQFLVAWHSDQGTNYDVFSRVVGDQGTIGAFIGIDATTANEKEPAVSCSTSGNQYLITWQQQYSSTSGPYGISGKLIYPDGQSGAAFGISGPYAGTTGDYQTEPAVAGGYHNYLTVWEQDRSGTAYQDIFGRLFTPHAIFLPLITR